MLGLVDFGLKKVGSNAFGFENSRSNSCGVEAADCSTVKGFCSCLKASCYWVVVDFATYSSLQNLLEVFEVRMVDSFEQVAHVDPEKVPLCAA